MLFYKCKLIVDGEKKTGEKVNYTMEIDNCSGQDTHPGTAWSRLDITVDFLTKFYCNDDD